MIKIDYEGAWKELKKTIECHISPTDIYKALLPYMKELEKKYTHDYIDIQRRSDKEIADYCLKKYTEIYLELVNLRRKLKELSKGNK